MVEEWLHALTEIHRGEVSLYKGFEHYNDRIPRVNVPKEFSGRSTPPAEYDLRTSYPKCFPLAGEEVVVIRAIAALAGPSPPRLRP
jgi:hypothetical protein